MFLDFAIGILISIVFHSYTGLKISYLLFYSLLFAVLPDLDFVIYKTLKIEPHRVYKHRNLFHYLLIYLPLGFAIIYLFNQTIAYLFVLASLFHFMHDSIAYGRGVRWLFPFSKNAYAFIYMYSRTKKGGLWQKMFVFNKDNLNQFDCEHADKDWVKKIYYSFPQIHPIAIIEYSAFLISIIMLIIYLIFNLS
jgi:membrane-bound metal-dependent hydrolase YbcI (DUF457 family)